MKYDNGEIDEEDISDEDMDKLIEMYEKETEELNKKLESEKIDVTLPSTKIKRGSKHPINRVIEQGSSSIELTDFSDVVFKRI